VADDTLLRISGNLSWFAQDGQLYCYHDLIGYILGMPPDIRELLAWHREPHTLAEAVEEFGRLLPEEMIRELVPTLQTHRCLVAVDEDELAALDDYVPVKARWRVAYTDPQGRTTLVLSRTSQQRPRFLELDALESSLWGLLDGQQTRHELGERLATQLDRPAAEVHPRVATALAAWTHHEAQVVKLHEVPLSFYKGRMHALPPYLTSTMPFPVYTGETIGPQRAGTTVDLRDYHRREIVDATVQFDEVETTLNHLFRLPHPALAGRTYPGALAAQLVQRGLLHPGGMRIVEVGGGTGTFARGFLEAVQREHPELLPGLSYTIVELSPALAESQRAQLAQGGFAELATVTAGEAEQLSWPAQSVDLLIANEMIGDLRAARVVLEELEADPGPAQRSSPEALATIRQYGIPVQDAPPEFHFNLGAVRFLERIADVLAPGGGAVLTEFGERHGYPRESEHLDHAEFSIHFGHLLHVAAGLGLQPEFEFLMDFLELDRSLRTLATTRPHLRNLQALFARHGRQLLKVAITADELRQLAAGALDYERIEALQFEKIEDRVCGLVPHHFKVLLCRKP